MSVATMTRPPRNRIKGVDWTRQKRVTLTGRLADDVTVGEIAEVLRQRMSLPHGSYAVYHDEQKLSRSATVAEIDLPNDAELELSPEVKAGGVR